MFRFDPLTPAELFLTVLASGGLLIWAALRARLRQRLVATAVGGVSLLRNLFSSAQASIWKDL